MYEQFFGLRERPFDLTPNPRFLCLTARHREALSNLNFAISSRKGLTLLLGEAGTGKTTLVRAAIASQNAPGTLIASVRNPTLTRQEFVTALARRFGLDRRAARSKAVFVDELEALLLQRLRERHVTVLIVDEAQSLPEELLEEIRLIANIETDDEKLLPVILAGQPELADRLNAPSLRQLKQRVSLRCELAPLSVHEMADYIASRLRIAGGSPGGMFTREAVTLIHAVSRGIPRMVNTICDNALVNAFATGKRPVSRAMVEEVARDFDLAASFDENGNGAGAHPGNGAVRPEVLKTIAAEPADAVPGNGAGGAADEYQPSAPAFSRLFSFIDGGR